MRKRFHITIDEYSNKEIQRIAREYEKMFGKRPTKQFCVHVITKRSYNFKMNLKQAQRLIIGYKGKVWL